MNNKQKKVKKSEETEDEIVFEENDLGDNTVKKLRTRLRECEVQKHEYLDGWQRLKAENVNTKKRDKEHEQRAVERAQQAVLEELIPILDSFDMAFNGDEWGVVDEVWRSGVEHIHAQLIDILKTYGYIAYGEVGDTFDPKYYEAIANINGGKSGNIAQVERKGYKNDDMVLRVARVITYE